MFTAYLKKCKKYIFSLFVLVSGVIFLCPLYARAEEENDVFNPVVPNNGYSAVLYNNQNGLPTSEANAIVQASDGFIWIGSYGGLVRYDGNNFERMDEEAGIKGVRSLFEDSKKRLWIGSSDKGIVMMEQGTFRHWDKPERFANSTVMTVAEDDNGLIYIGTQKGIAIINKNMEMQAIDDERVSENNISELKKGSDGLIYGLAQDGDIFTLKDGKVIFYLNSEDCPISSIQAILPDPENPGYIYAGTALNDLYHGKPENNFEGYEECSITPLGYTQNLEYIDGKVWICCVNGVAMLNGFQSAEIPTEENEHISALNNVPMNNSYGHAMCDYLGNYWFTSTRQGVMKIVPNQFQNLSERYGMKGNVVNTVCMYEGNLLIGTDKNFLAANEYGVMSSYKVISETAREGLEKYTQEEFEEPEDEETIKYSEEWEIFKKSKEFAKWQQFEEWKEYEQWLEADEEERINDDFVNMYDGARIRSFTLDSHDRLWIGDWNQFGLICCENGGYVRIQDLTSIYIRNVCELDDGSVAVALNGGLDVVKDKKVIKHYTEKNGIANTDSLTAAKGDNGDIFLGSDGGGLYVINGDSVMNIGQKDGLTSGVVMHIKRDRTRDLFWIVTGNSIAFMTPDYKITTVTSFPHSNNFDLFQNSKDEMWVLSGNGIYIVPTKDMIDDNVTQFQHYGLSDGLPYIATANSYSYLDKDGTLYIAGNNGVASVNIESFRPESNTLKGSVPFIDADEERIYPDKDGNFHISSDVRKLTIYGYVFNYSLITPQVSYRLEGFDDKYITVSRDVLMPVDYTNLAGGDYRFVMKISDGNGTEVTVNIRKDRAFYEQIWFYIVMGLLDIAILSVIAQLIWIFRMKKLKRKHREEVERERITTELQTATNIQSSMLPNVFPPFPDRNEFDIFASMTPAKEVGGDFYDFFMIDDDHLCLEIADVSGKGVPASLFMMAAKIIIADFAEMGKSPAEILEAANNKICSNNKEEMFVTVWLGILEISTGKLTAANAGHEYPAILKPDGKFELFKDKHRLAIGGCAGTKYINYELMLEPGSKLFVYTDGVPEATNAEEDMFDTDNMLEALNKEPNASPEHLLENVRQAVDDFVKNEEQFDDLTMLCLEYKGK